MDGFWKFLDNMAESDPEEYQKFIDGQMKEMKTEMKKEEEKEIQELTIKSQPSFCMKTLVYKKVDPDS